MAKDGYRIHIVDDFNPMLEEFAKLSWVVGLEVLSKSGNEIRNRARKAMTSKKHEWHQRMAQARNGDYKGLVAYKGSNTKQLGSRQSQKTGAWANPASMSSMITSYLMETKGTVVVGGMHRRFTPKTFRNGLVTGSEKSVNAVGKKTFAIINKLNTGKRNSDHAWNGSKRSMKGFENANYKANDFMGQGFRNAKSIVDMYMTKRLEESLHRTANNIKVAPKRISS